MGLFVEDAAMQGIASPTRVSRMTTLSFFESCTLLPRGVPIHLAYTTTTGCLHPTYIYPSIHLGAE